MYQFSDSDSIDSDEGIRFKTDSTRNKQGNELNSRTRDDRRRSRSPSRRSRDSRMRSSDRQALRQKSSKSKKHKKEARRRSSSVSSSDRNRRKPEHKGRSEAKTAKSEDVTTEPKLEAGSSPSKKADKCQEDPKTYGPLLPFASKQAPKRTDQNEAKPDDQQEEEANQEDLKAEEEETIIGPALPPHLLNKTPQSDEAAALTPCIGPQLPPHLLTDQIPEEDLVESPRIGPTLPPHLREKLLAQSASASEDEDDEVLGPLPVGHSSYSKAQIALEERALQLKLDQLEPGEDKAPVREEWMLELPEVKAAGLGLGPRQFRSKAGPDLSDRSSWTDTPEQKAKKPQGKSEEVDLKKDAELMEVRRRNKEQEAMAKKHRKKNKESLVELHQNKLKKQKKEEKGGPSERRPFSREVDLQVNRFDEAQKEAILKKAQLLDDRFSSGQSKFL